MSKVGRVTGSAEVQVAAPVVEAQASQANVAISEVSQAQTLPQTLLTSEQAATGIIRSTKDLLTELKEAENSDSLGATEILSSYTTSTSEAQTQSLDTSSIGSTSEPQTLDSASNDNLVPEPEIKSQEEAAATESFKTEDGGGGEACDITLFSGPSESSSVLNTVFAVSAAFEISKTEAEISEQIAGLTIALQEIASGRKTKEQKQNKNKRNKQPLLLIIKKLLALLDDLDVANPSELWRVYALIEQNEQMFKKATYAQTQKWLSLAYKENNLMNNGEAKYPLSKNEQAVLKRSEYYKTALEWAKRHRQVSLVTRSAKARQRYLILSKPRKCTATAQDAINLTNKCFETTLLCQFAYQPEHHMLPNEWRWRKDLAAVIARLAKLKAHQGRIWSNDGLSAYVLENTVKGDLALVLCASCVRVNTDGIGVRLIARANARARCAKVYLFVGDARELYLDGKKLVIALQHYAEQHGFKPRVLGHAFGGSIATFAASFVTKPGKPFRLAAIDAWPLSREMKLEIIEANSHLLDQALIEKATAKFKHFLVTENKSSEYSWLDDFSLIGELFNLAPLPATTIKNARAQAEQKEQTKLALPKAPEENKLRFAKSPPAFLNDYGDQVNMLADRIDEKKPL